MAHEEDGSLEEGSPDLGTGVNVPTPYPTTVPNYPVAFLVSNFCTDIIPIISGNPVTTTKPSRIHYFSRTVSF